MTKYTKDTKVVYMVYREKATTLQKIEKAANQLIFTFGVKGWNMEDCSREAGITKRTLYKYIDSKEKLIEHVLSEFILTTQQKLVQDLSDSPDFITGMEKMLHIFPRMILKMESRIIQNIFTTYPDIENHIIEKRATLADVSLTYIRKAQQDGYVKQEIQAETVLEIIQSLVIYYSKNDPENFEVKLKKALASVLYGILAYGKVN